MTTTGSAAGHGRGFAVYCSGSQSSSTEITSSHCLMKRRHCVSRSWSVRVSASAYCDFQYCKCCRAAISASLATWASRQVSNYADVGGRQDDSYADEYPSSSGQDALPFRLFFGAGFGVCVSGGLFSSARSRSSARFAPWRFGSRSSVVARAPAALRRARRRGTSKCSDSCEGDHHGPHVSKVIGPLTPFKQRTSSRSASAFNLLRSVSILPLPRQMSVCSSTCSPQYMVR
jgi:hypothetical protein